MTAWRAFILFLPLVAVAQSQPSGVVEETPYVPTPQNVVEAMLQIAGVRGTDFVMDLGSGDGRIVIAAATRYGARGLGIDYDRHLIEQSERNAISAGVADRVGFLQNDISEVSFAPATVLTLYLMEEFNLALRPKILAQLRPGARVVSHDWSMGDWEPDVKVEIAAPDKPVGVKKSSTVYCWIVPARVAGRWRTRVVLDDDVADVDLAITQRYQALGGTATVNGASVPLERGRVQGQLVFFRFGRAGGEVRFEGQLKTDRIAGKVTAPSGRTHPWRALRIR